MAVCASLVLVVGGGLARADGTIPCSLSITDASGQPITSITANTTVVLTGTATIARDFVGGTSGDVALFQDGTTGYDVTGEPMTIERQGTDLVFTLRTSSFLAGDHSITFTFLAFDGSDICQTDPILLHVGELAPTDTETTVDLSSASIDAGQTIDITASVVQSGTTIAPPGGLVSFYSKQDGTSDFIQLGAAQPLVDGHAAVHDIGGFTAGKYTIEARYSGDTFAFGASSGDADLSVHGSSVLTYTSPGSATVGDTATLGATLTNGELVPAAGRQVTFEIVATGDHCDATTDATGNAHCDVVVHGPAGPSDVAVSFAGDDLYGASSDTGHLTITRAATNLAVAAAAGTSHGSATLSATLTTAAGAPLANQAVTLSVVGNPAETCTGTTNGSGVASCATTVAEPAGTYGVHATFGGTADEYLPSHGDGQLTVVAAPTTLTYTGSPVAVPGISATISFTLKAGTTPLAGQAVTIVWDGTPYATTTNASGVASITITPTGTSDHTAAATFDGDGYYAPSSKTQTVPSGIPTSLQYIGDTAVVSGGTAQLKVKLLDAQANAPLPTATVQLSLATGETCTATTDANGIGSCGVVVNAGAGPDTVTATFAGVGPYTGSSTTATLVVSAQRTAIVLAPVGPVLHGSSVRLSAFLVSLQTLHPLANKPVTLSFGSQSCTATTSFFGFAECTINPVTAPVGNVTATATFAGDPQAQASSASWQTIVYALAPGNCWFVVGDRDDDGNVNFWGSQWSKNNRLSHGSGPSSFKGYSGVTATSLHAGSTWTAKTGNSSSPPKGPLPEYMAVIVSSSVKQSGSTISGDIAKIVIVKTDGGYDSNPGHAGTGTVVATVDG